MLGKKKKSLKAENEDLKSVHEMIKKDAIKKVKGAGTEVPVPSMANKNRVINSIEGIIKGGSYTNLDNYFKELIKFIEARVN